MDKGDTYRVLTNQNLLIPSSSCATAWGFFLGMEVINGRENLYVMKTFAPPLHHKVFVRCQQLLDLHVSNGIKFIIGHWTNVDLRDLLSGRKALLVMRRGEALVIKYVDAGATQFWFDAWGHE